MKKKYFYNIDFLRFIFCISILLFHFSLRSAIPMRDKMYEFLKLHANYSFGYLCVEFFFIISGFMWCLSLDKEKQISLLEFAKKKIIRFSPVMFFTVICFFIISFWGLTTFEGPGNILALSFLSGLGFRHSYLVNEFGNIHPCWFISVLFWVLILYRYLHHNWQKKNFNLFIVLVVVFGYNMLTGAKNGKISNPLYPLFNFLNFGLVRGLCGIGIGYLIGEVYKTYLPKVENIKLSIIPAMMLTIINFLALSFILSNLFYAHTQTNNDIFFIFCFVIVMFCFTFNKDLISKFFNNKYFAFMGKYTFSIYILHCLIMDIFKYGVLTDKNLTTIKMYPYLYFYSAVIISIISGIIVYYTVEKPANKYLTEKLSNFK